VVLGFQFYHGASLEFFPVGYEIKSLGFGLHLRLDAVSLWLTILTTFLTPLAIAFSRARPDQDTRVGTRTAHRIKREEKREEERRRQRPRTPREDGPQSVAEIAASMAH